MVASRAENLVRQPQIDVSFHEQIAITSSNPSVLIVAAHLL